MKNRRGFALLTAIWMIVAISIAGLQLAIEARHARLAAINLVQDSRGRALASGAFDLTRARLDLAMRLAAQNGPVQASQALADSWMGIDTLMSGTERIGEASVHITVRSLGAKMNINRASEAEFRNFFVANQIDYSVAEELSQTIMDWRDVDENYRARGAEREYYIREGLLNLPRNNLFESVDELRYVEGMTPEIFELVAPQLTVWGSGRINLNTAERPVLLSLTGMNEAAVAQLISLRESGRRLTNVNELSQYLGGVNLPNNRTAIAVDELEVEALATAPDGHPIVRAFGVVRRAATGNTSQLTNWRVD